MPGLSRYSLSMVFYAILCSGCGTMTGAGMDKRPAEVLMLNQCNREMTALDEQVASMGTLLKSGEPAIDVLEEAQRLRQEIPSVEMKCSANEAAVSKLKKLDQDLAALMKQLEVEGYH